ncbi:MAG TPA: helix-turn-helix domain-containing protein, partial [Smithellaceae bacterium]|nr:helix-turn-helix domain-containing protein [Smithellaceae bacterium]HNY96845.1 helix-turn-helix domain-containing protein [Smithellaceae bacterium]HOH57969.1 helix-turn-helix domain-containing protein [Smithellaceae bacterium]HPV72962.1 helix-turn-helix domain-containing protein [Smithellaceae bacterium]
MTTEQNANSSIPDLKAARQNSGLTLKEMFERTRISVVNLEAMENGRFHLLPVPIYTRNFIKTYAAALGVDSKPVLQRYEDYLQALKNKEREQAAVKSPRAPLAETLGRHKIVLWAASIVILVAAASIFATVYNKTPTEARLAIESSGDAASGAAPVQST